MEAETGSDFLKSRMSTAKFVGCPRVPKTKSLELGRKVSKMVTIEIIEISRIVRSKFRNAPREIKMSGIASGDSFEFEVGGLPPG
jgi:hypothetical protein